MSTGIPPKNTTLFSDSLNGVSRSEFTDNHQERQSQVSNHQQKKQQKDKEIQMDAVENINSYIQSVHRELKFEVSESTDDIIITVFDEDTEEIIRQIPSEEILALKQKLQEYIESDIGDAILFNAKT